MSLERCPNVMKSDGRHAVPKGTGKAFNLRILLVIAISTLVLAGILGVSALHSIVFTNYARNEAQHRLNDAAEMIATMTERLLEPAAVIARHILDQRSESLGAADLDDRQDRFDRFLESMDIVRGLHSHLSAVYLGYPDGSVASLTQNSPELRLMISPASSERST